MTIFAMMVALLAWQEDVDSVLEKMGKASTGTRTMVAGYEQVKTLSLLDEETYTRGRMYFDRKSGTTRWQAEDGTIQQLEKDRYIAVFPGLKEVEIYSLKEKGATFAALLGSPDAGVLKEDFVISLGPRTEKSIELILLPRKDFLKKRIREARLRLDPKTHRVWEAAFTELNGDALLIRIRETKRNEPLPDGTFDLDLDDLRTKGYNIREHK